jgi:hypothetical protein
MRDDTPDIGTSNPRTAMILLDRPYVSDILRRTVVDHALPVVLTPAARELGFADAPGAVTEEAAVGRLREDPHARVLTNSENALGWVAANLGFTRLPAAIELCKNKLAFRRLLADLYPDFRYREVGPDDLDGLDPEAIGHPFVIKPAVGFFSLGVQVVNRPDQWPAARRALADQLAAPSALYPREVLDASRLILEEIITGTEYAVDAYYDATGEPVITNILQHLFSSEDDVSDRVYVTGEEVVMGNLERFTAFLDRVGRLAGWRDFPVHVEVRVDASGRITPIEFNPLRFGGWCTTADLTLLGYGLNPYLAFLNDERPDWPAIFAARRGVLYSIVVLDDTTGLAPHRITGFDYEKLAAWFARPLEIRPMDLGQAGVFGFLFAATPADRRDELERILHSDLREFVRVSGDR